MNRIKFNLSYVFLVLGILILSISSTLALIQDSETKVGNVLKFDKVSIFADKAGEGEKKSVLSLNLDPELCVDNGVQVINNENPLMVATTADTADCFIRVRFYFTTNIQSINEDVSDATNYAGLLESVSGVPNGLVLYSNENYEYAVKDGWAYLVINDGIENQTSTTLKVATKEDKSFILTQNYSFSFDELTLAKLVDLYLAIEEQGGEISLVTEVQAMQAYNLHTVDIDNGQILAGASLEETYGFVTIENYENAVIQNQVITGLPQKKLSSLEQWTWKEIQAASNYIEESYNKGFLIFEEKQVTLNLNSKNTVVKYNEIVLKNSPIKIGPVKITYETTGTYGSSSYNKIFTFREGKIVNSISLRQLKSFSMKKIDYNGNYQNANTTMTMMVSDFLHDKKADGTFAGISFTAKNMYSNVTSKRRNASYDTAGGYYASNDFARKFIDNYLYPAMEEALGEGVIKEVQKSARLPGNTNSSKVETHGRHLWMLGYGELVLARYVYAYYKTEGLWYPTYVTNADRVKYYEGYSYPSTYWLRTACATVTDCFVNLDPDGSLDNEEASRSNNTFGIAIGFCV